MSLIAMASALAATIANPTPEATSSPTVERERTLTEIIAFETGRNRRMTVPVTIRGEGPFRFLVDTGARRPLLRAMSPISSNCLTATR